jgi:(R)-2-hydroxyacyl-CoA dehydratese activating ATPase
MVTAGIDIGSVSSKIVLLKDDEIAYKNVTFSGYRPAETGAALLEEGLASCGIGKSGVHAIYSTGYGRKTLDFANKAVTEILCHAAGAHFSSPEVSFLIDIGGQDSKAIELDGRGGVKDFVMNDRCAAGTGRFLEVIARALETGLEDFAQLSLQSGSPASISSTCTVFAESEVISLISHGISREDIAAGIHLSVARRTLSMARRLTIKEPVMFSGGVALNQGVVAAMEKELGVTLMVSPYTQVNGALGAAILAKSWK